MNVFEVLKQDHQRVRELFSQVTKTEKRHKQTREDVFQELKRALIAHGHAEEKAFYPQVHRPPAEEIVDEGINEHHEVEKMLGQIDGISVESDEWLGAINNLQRMVEHHLREEENELFPKAEKMLAKEQLDPLGDKFTETEDQEKRQISH